MKDGIFIKNKDFTLNPFRGIKRSQKARPHSQVS